MFEAREKERAELESQIMDLTMSVFDGADTPAGDDAAKEVSEDFSEVIS